MNGGAAYTNVGRPVGHAEDLDRGRVPLAVEQAETAIPRGATCTATLVRNLDGLRTSTSAAGQRRVGTDVAGVEEKVNEHGDLAVASSLAVRAARTTPDLALAPPPGSPDPAGDSAVVGDGVERVGRGQPRQTLRRAGLRHPEWKGTHRTRGVREPRQAVHEGE